MAIHRVRSSIDWIVSMLVRASAAWMSIPPVVAQYYVPGPSIPLPRPSPYYSQLTRALIGQQQMTGCIGPQLPSGQEVAGSQRIRAGLASTSFVSSPDFSITDHLLSPLSHGREAESLRTVTRANVAQERAHYVRDRHSGGGRSDDMVDTLADAFTIAFRIAVGQGAPENYVTHNAAVIRQRLLGSVGFQGMSDLDRQRVAEEVGVRAAYADTRARAGTIDGQADAREQASVILTSIYGAMPSPAFLAAVTQGRAPP